MDWAHRLQDEDDEITDGCISWVNLLKMTVNQDNHRVRWLCLRVHIRYRDLDGFSIRPFVHICVHQNENSLVEESHSRPDYGDASLLYRCIDHAYQHSLKSVRVIGFDGATVLRG